MELSGFSVSCQTATPERGKMDFNKKRKFLDVYSWPVATSRSPEIFISWRSISVLLWILVQTSPWKTPSTSPWSHFPQLTKQQQKAIPLQFNAFRKDTKLYQVWSFSIFQKAKRIRSGMLRPNRHRRAGDGLVLHGTEMRVLFLESVVLFSPSAASRSHTILSELNSVSCQAEKRGIVLKSIKIFISEDSDFWCLS